MSLKSKEERAAYQHAYYLKNKDRWKQDKTHKAGIHKTWWEANKHLITPPRPVQPCPICGKIEKMVLDHDHEKDTSRDWICFDCNCALGLAHENPYILLSMVKYLNEWSIKTGPPYKRLRYIHRRGPRI